MSKSLNEAFLRAYSKERPAASGTRQKTEPVESGRKDNNDPMAMRVDTAAVDIPRPQVLNQATRADALKPAVIRVATDEQSQTSSENQRINDSSQAARTARETESPITEPEDSVTEPKCSARISDISGGEPGNSVGEPRSPATESKGPIYPEDATFDCDIAVGGSWESASWQTEINAIGIWAEQPVDNTDSQPETALPSEQEDVSEQGVDSASPGKLAELMESSPGGPPEQDPAAIFEAAASEMAQRPNIQDQAVVTERTPETGLGPHWPDVSTPAAAVVTFNGVAEAVDQLATTRREQGEIFRLDRPSYTSETTVQTPQPAEPIVEPSHPASRAAGKSEDAPSQEQQAAAPLTTSPDSPLNVATLDDADEDKSHAKVEAARTVEEGLRQARLKVFNPVWEVDCLQWPAICRELLNQRAENLERVAKNLTAACQEGLQVLAVTSPSPGAGRTTVACCLAMLAGRQGLKVAVIDGDIENPQLTSQTNLDVEQDWKMAMLQQMPLEEIAVHSIDDQVTLLPLIRPIHEDEIASDDNRIAFMLHELSESFDLVIVDTGHMESTRSLVTSMGEQGMINAVVAVVDSRSSSPQRLDACIRRIRRTGISSVGLVENFAA